MHYFQQVKKLFLKDLSLEIKHFTALSSSLLYLFCIVFIHYLGIEIAEMSSNTGYWNVQFWLCMVLISIFIIPKYFYFSCKKRPLYYFSLVMPEIFWIAKVLYTTFILLLISFLTFLIFGILFFFPFNFFHLPYFFVVLLGGIFFFVLTFGLTSFLAFRSRHGYLMTAVLGIPLVLPVVALLFKTTLYLMHGIIHPQLIGLLMGSNVIIFFLSLLLFPYLWQQ